MATTSEYLANLARWENLLESGINGRGVARPGTTKTVNSRTVKIGDDVTNQASQPDKAL